MGRNLEEETSKRGLDVWLRVSSSPWLLVYSSHGLRGAKAESPKAQSPP